MYLLRINDPSVSFHQGNDLRFSPTNPFDFILYSDKLFCLELKSTESTSMTFYREDFIDKEDKKKRYSFMVKRNQIEGLLKASKYKGIIAGLILNFRKNNYTYFIEINQFIEIINKLDKKSFNENDIKDFSYMIEQQIKKIHYKYNIEKFIADMQTLHNG